MGYENAPATAMLATHCAVCHRALLDAESVELGIGPECRKKYGFLVDVAPEARAEANKIVHAVAVGVTQGMAPETLRAALATLSLLGFTVLSGKLAEGAAAVRVGVSPDGRLSVVSPYVPAFSEDLKRECKARWDKENKAWLVGAAKREWLWTIIKRHFAGHLVMGTKGLAVA